MIKAVIFDMDGVLFDTERVAVRSWEKAGRDLGVPGMGSIVPSVLGVSQSGCLGVKISVPVMPSLREDCSVFDDNASYKRVWRNLSGSAKSHIQRHTHIVLICPLLL